MIVTQEAELNIKKEFSDFKTNMYGHNTLKERKDLDQFYTPPEFTIPMINSFNSVKSISEQLMLDPTCGSGNLLVGCLLAGARIENLYGNEWDEDMVKLCRERLVKVCLEYNRTEGKTKEELERIVSLHIHQGNALHKFCVDVFDEHYEECYFAGEKGVLTSPTWRIKRMKDKQANANAYQKYSNFNKVVEAEQLNKGITEERKNVSHSAVKGQAEDYADIF